jgi:hypothetical protein
MIYTGKTISEGPFTLSQPLARTTFLPTILNLFLLTYLKVILDLNS